MDNQVSIALLERQGKLLSIGLSAMENNNSAMLNGLNINIV